MAIACLQRSLIWIIGAAIWLVGAIMNMYFELAIKEAIRKIDPRVPSPFLDSGFVQRTEFLPTTCVSLIAFLYFFILFSTIQVEQVLKFLFIEKRYLIIGGVLALATITARVIITRWSQERPDIRSVLGRVMVGQWVLVVIWMILALLGDKVDSDSIKLTRISLFSAQPAPLWQWLRGGSIIAQIWFATSITMLAQIFSYFIVIMLFLMEAPGYKTSVQNGVNAKAGRN
jgi:hypothetical protein